VALSEEIAELDAQLERLVAQAAPELVLLPGVGTNHAATLLILAGDNPERDVIVAGQGLQLRGHSKV